MEYTIFYDSADATAQSILAKAIAKIKYPSADIIDIAGENEAAIDALIAAVGDGTQTDIIITVPIVDAHATGKFTVTQAVACVAKLTTASQAVSSNLTGTAQTNTTKTDIILDAATDLADDALNNKLIVTAGTTAVSRLITDYTGIDDTCVVTDTGTAITAVDTYTVYMTSHLVLAGAYSGSDDSCRLAWDTMYPYQTQAPLVVAFLENAATLYEKNDKTATSVGTAELSDTGEFAGEDYSDGIYYLAITNGSTAGEVRLIRSNTDDKLILETDYDVPLTGTPTYQIVKDNLHTLWNKYIPHAIAGWLQLDNTDTNQAWQKILDRHDDLIGAAARNRKFYQDTATLEDYLDKGKHVLEAVAAGIVS